VKFSGNVGNGSVND